MEKITATVRCELDGTGILSFLKNELGLSVTLVKKVKYGGVFINGQNVHMRATVHGGDTVEVILPSEDNSEIKPIPMPLDIVYEDEWMIAVNKPSGMPTHPSRGNSLPTLAEGIMAYFSQKSFVFRSVNRLDRDTSGIVLIAKDTVSAAKLSSGMKRGEFEKTYVAILSGVPTPENATVDAPIERECADSIKRTVRVDGKRALTEYKVIRRLADGNSLCEIKLHTGRTHQIRVHMAYIGHPLVADFLYGERIDGKSYKLHAKTLSFIHPITNERITLTSRAEFEDDE